MYFPWAGASPGAEEHLKPQILVEVGVSDFFERLDVRDGDEVRVQVHELDADLLEGALRQDVALDARQRLVRVVVRLSPRHRPLGGDAIRNPKFQIQAPRHKTLAGCKRLAPKAAVGACRCLETNSRHSHSSYERSKARDAPSLQ